MPQLVRPLAVVMNAEASANFGLAEQRARWGDAVDPGLLIVPGLLLKQQRRLNLTVVDLLVILNLVELWDEGENMPVLQLKVTSVLARRMCRDRRTIERSLAKLAAAGLVQRLPSETHRGRTVRKFNLSGLRDKLVALSRQESGINSRRRASAA